MKTLRSPNCVLVGHVDHGKSTILERIAGKSITSKEAGGITQSIAAYKTTQEKLKELVKNLDPSLTEKVQVSGILFIDTPGHAAFTSMRQRGGSIADIAVLVIDIREGIKEQTIESIKILKEFKTPFIIALNKVDLISGWRVQENKALIETINSQSDQTRKELEEKLYTIVGKLSELGFQSDRFDRVDDFTSKIAIIPTNAEKNEGLVELVLLIAGLAQKFLEDKLKMESNVGKGVVIEVNETKGMGTTAQIILFEGELKKNDTIILGGIEGATETKVKGIFEDERGKLKPQNQVTASAAITLSAQGLEQTTSGMPMRVANKNASTIKKEIEEEIQEVISENDNEGIIVKADTLGSLEALTKLLRDIEVPIRKTAVGNINKKDIASASSDHDEFNRVILGFNVDSEESEKVKIISEKVIYKIVEKYEKWKEKLEKKNEEKEIANLPKPFKLQILKDHVFRTSNPAVIGVEVLQGTMKTGRFLIKPDGSKAGELKAAQKDKKTVDEVLKDEEVAASITGVTVGRQIDEEDVLISDVNEADFRRMKELSKYLSEDEKDLLKEIAVIKRKSNSSWGV